MAWRRQIVLFLALGASVAKLYHSVSSRQPPRVERGDTLAALLIGIIVFVIGALLLMAVDRNHASSAESARLSLYTENQRRLSVITLWVFIPVWSVILIGIHVLPLEYGMRVVWSGYMIMCAVYYVATSLESVRDCITRKKLTLDLGIRAILGIGGVVTIGAGLLTIGKLPIGDISLPELAGIGTLFAISYILWDASVRANS